MSTEIEVESGEETRIPGTPFTVYHSGDEERYVLIEDAGAIRLPHGDDWTVWIEHPTVADTMTVPNLTVPEEYALWLAETGVDDSATDDLNEGCDPITERGGEVSDEDWRAGMKLAHDIAAWVRANPRFVLDAVAAEKEQRP